MFTLMKCSFFTPFSAVNNYKMGPKKSQNGKDQTKSWVENMKKKGTYNDYLKRTKDTMAERQKKMRRELAVTDDDARSKKKEN